MQAPVEIRYAGVMISRAQEVQAVDGDESSFFVSTREPMPVGTVVRLRSGERETPARVVHAVEAVGGATAGMQIRFIGESEEVAPEFIPPAAPFQIEPEAKEETHRSISGQTLLGAGMTVSPSAVAEEAMELPADPTAHPPTSEPVVPSAAFELAIAAVDAGAGSVNDAPPPAQAAPEPAAGVAPVEEPQGMIEATEGKEPVAAQVTVEAAAEASGDVAEAVPIAVGTSMSDALENAAAAVSEPSGPPESLPPARPLAGPSTRRKTRRRK